MYYFLSLVFAIIIGFIETQTIIPINEMFVSSKSNYSKLLNFDMPNWLFFGVTASFSLVSTILEVGVIHLGLGIFLVWPISVYLSILFRLLLQQDWKNWTSRYEISLKITLTLLMLVMDQKEALIWYMVWNLCFSLGVLMSLLVQTRFGTQLLEIPKMTKAQRRSQIKQNKKQKKSRINLEGVPETIQPYLTNIVDKLQ